MKKLGYRDLEQVNGGINDMTVIYGADGSITYYYNNTTVIECTDETGTYEIII